MARVKDENGLTHQQELFCQYVVDAYGDNPQRILTTAYRMAYNCKSDALDKTHWEKASRLYNEGKVKTRIEQLKAQQAEYLSISLEEIVSQDVKAINLDPLVFLKYDEKNGRYKPRKLEEFPKSVRLILRSHFVNGVKVYYVDKDKCLERIIDLLQYKKTTTEIHHSGTLIGEELAIIPQGFEHLYEPDELTSE